MGAASIAEGTSAPSCGALDREGASDPAPDLGDAQVGSGEPPHPPDLSSGLASIEFELCVCLLARSQRTVGNCVIVNIRTCLCGESLLYHFPERVSGFPGRTSTLLGLTLTVGSLKLSILSL